MSSRYAFLRSGVWIVGLLIAFLTVILFASLGMWQLQRLDERQALNATVEARMAAEPIEFGVLLAENGVDPEVLEYRRVTVAGIYGVEDEIILQARTLNSRSGHNVVTPLTWEGGVVAVNRGWVPIDSEGPPVPTARPPDGEVVVTGILLTSEERGPTGVENPDGSYDNIGRLDLALLEPQWGPGLAGVYVQLEAQDPPQGAFPIPLPSPEIGEGPHLSYAIQWFVFALIIMIGFPSLVVSTARRPRPTTSASPSIPSSGA